MRRILVLFAHPNQQLSNVNVAMIHAIQDIEGVRVIDLYAQYPRFKIDINKEQARLLDHDVIIFQFPFYWYSTPSILKEWMDLTLEHGFAYGDEGSKLAGKLFMLATTTGAAETNYKPDETRHICLRSLLSPLEKMAHFCQMTYLSPYVLYSASEIEECDGMKAHVAAYKKLLIALRDETLDIDQAVSADYLEHHNLPIK